jgi:hypothetical protein
MKYLFFLLLLFSGPVFSQEQGADTSFSVEKHFRGAKSCVEIETAAFTLVPALYRHQMYDSLELMLDFVRMQCYEGPTLRMLRILLDIERRRLADSSLSAWDMYFMETEATHLYQSHLAELDAHAQRFTGDTTQWLLQAALRDRGLEAPVVETLVIWCQKLRERPDLRPLERAIVTLLASQRGSQSLFRHAARPGKHNRHVRRTYGRYHRGYHLRNSTTFSVGLNLWSPLGNLGQTAGLTGGFQLGLGATILDNLRYELYCSFTGGKTRVPYQVVRPDTSFSSNRLAVVYLGIDLGFALFRLTHRFQASAIGGAGYARFLLAFPLDEEEHDDHETVNDRLRPFGSHSFYAMAGGELKYFYKKSNAFFLQARHNWNRFSSGDAAQSLKGNAWQFNAGLIFHIFGHPSHSALQEGRVR